MKPYAPLVLFVSADVRAAQTTTPTGPGDPMVTVRLEFKTDPASTQTLMLGIATADARQLSQLLADRADAADRGERG